MKVKRTFNNIVKINGSKLCYGVIYTTLFP